VITSLQKRYAGHDQLLNVDLYNAVQSTHTRNFLHVTRRVYPQNLDRSRAALIVTHPHVRKPTVVPWGL